MIQRIQSIYLLLAAVVLGASFFLPLATATGDTAALAATGDNFFADGVYQAQEFPAGWSWLVGALMVALVIFRYKDRKKQMFSTGMAAVYVALLLVLFGALGFYYANSLPAGAAAHVSTGSAGLPVSLVLLFLAYRAIKKDEDLVRSSDRLR